MVWPNSGVSHRPPVTGLNAAVSSAHPLASLAGLTILKEGGNAIDAAVAVAAALNVVEPLWSGAAGVGYMTIRVAGRSEPLVLDYTGHAPSGAEPGQFSTEADKNDGIRSPLVPGALAGWLAALERLGTMDRKHVFRPAIEYARNGFAVTPGGHHYMSPEAERLRKWKTSSAVFLPDGEIPRPGSILKQVDLGRTLEIVVEGGAEAFYRGPIAKEIVRFSQSHGGLLTSEDLANYEPSWHEPISINYRGFDIYCPPLPCSGMQYLQTLKIVEGFDMAGMGQNSADYIHHLAEAMKLAVADRTTYAPDADAPIAGLLSDHYLTSRRQMIDPMRAAYSGGVRFTSTKHPDEVLPGSPESINHEGTTHFVTADSAGNAVSCTQTLGSRFGSGIVYGNTGLILNNFANWFDLDPESPNVIAPGKKVEMCLAPSQIWREGDLVGLVGTPGSWGIMQTTPQMIMNLLDHGNSIQAAIEAPRFRTLTGTELPLEGRIGPEVVEELRNRGHEVQVMDDWTAFVGGGHGILVDPESGAYYGGADPRRDGYALAY